MSIAEEQERAILLQTSKRAALRYQVGIPLRVGYKIPGPKSSVCGREGRILRNTSERVGKFRYATTMEFRADCFRGKFSGLEYLPHPYVLAEESTAKAWMEKFSKSTERNIAHAPEQALCFVEGLPLLVSFQDSHM